MKVLSFVVPSYNSQDYLARAVDSLLPGGDQVEILIVNDGSTDCTDMIANEYGRKFPNIVRVLHQENAGHGSAILAGLKAAAGVYFKVIDSDDWADPEAYRKVLAKLGEMSSINSRVDLFISNYVYEKVGARHKRAIRYSGILPEGRVFGWEETGSFPMSRYILMHSAFYRTDLLRACSLNLPWHTFYVDTLFVCIPMPFAKKLYYLNTDFYRYFIGRGDQSVKESVMIRRVDQQILVNKLLVDAIAWDKLKEPKLRAYLLHHLRIITVISSVLLIKSGTAQNMEKLRALWEYLRQKHPGPYRVLRRSLMGMVIHIPGALGRALVVFSYRVSQWLFGFN